MTSLLITPKISSGQQPGEDVMDLYTEADRRLGQDEDIDVDLDFREDQYQVPADEDMAEDIDYAQQQDGGKAEEGAESADALMEDERYSVRDEELQDAGIADFHEDDDVLLDEFEDEIVEYIDDKPQSQMDDPQDTAIRSPHGAGRDVYGNVEPALEEPSTEEDRLALQGTIADESEHAVPVAQGHDEPLQVEDQYADEGQAETAIDASVAPPISDRDEIERPQDTPNITQHIDIQASTEENASFHDEGPHQTSAYLHPIRIIYQDTEMSLFPPLDYGQGADQTFLLRDETLAHESMKNLLWACRAVLGESIGMDDELKITVDDLDLTFSEVGSWNASSLNLVSDPSQCTSDHLDLTLAKIVSLFIQLHQNDGADKVPPLHVRLDTRPRLSQRWNFLLRVAEQGQGVSHVISVDRFEPPEAEEDLEHETEIGAQSTHDSGGGASVAPPLEEAGIEQESLTFDGEARLRTLADNIDPPDLTGSGAMQAMNEGSGADDTVDGSEPSHQGIGPSKRPVQGGGDSHEESPEGAAGVSLEADHDRGHPGHENASGSVSSGEAAANVRNSPTDSSTLQDDNDADAQLLAIDGSGPGQPAADVSAAAAREEAAPGDNSNDFGELDDDYNGELDDGYDGEEARSRYEYATAYAKQDDIIADERPNAVGSQDLISDADLVEDNAFLTAYQDDEVGPALHDDDPDYDEDPFEGPDSIQDDAVAEQIHTQDREGSIGSRGETLSTMGAGLDHVLNLIKQPLRDSMAVVNEEMDQHQSFREVEEIPSHQWPRSPEQRKPTPNFGSDAEPEEEDEDEITYEDADIHNDSTVTSAIPQNADLYSGSLKRPRSPVDEDDVVEGDAQGLSSTPS